jgi:hypothetical protein
VDVWFCCLCARLYADFSFLKSLVLGWACTTARTCTVACLGDSSFRRDFVMQVTGCNYVQGMADM